MNSKYIKPFGLWGTPKTIKKYLNRALLTTCEVFVSQITATLMRDSETYIYVSSLKWSSIEFESETHTHFIRNPFSFVVNLLVICTSLIRGLVFFFHKKGRPLSKLYMTVIPTPHRYYNINISAKYHN